MTRRYLGVPLLFAVAYSSVGFSLYFALGLVADRGLGLTPLIFLGVGLLFLLNAMTYVEGEAVVPERGGSATFARRAFRNELVSFVAGWAILIDYVIVIALAAISVPHYLTPIWDGFTDSGGEVITGGLVIALIAWLSSRLHRRPAPAAAGGDLAGRRAAAGGGDRRRPDHLVRPRCAHRSARPLHKPDPRGRDLRGRDRHGGVRRDRGGRQPRAGPRSTGPSTCASCSSSRPPSCR